ncbi:hypothetical protein FACS1894120_0750 [Clostridia bacterium]|nr:hypothetical protein FACS1894120_0750 [Clostridia bacterium]
MSKWLFVLIGCVVVLGLAVLLLTPVSTVTESEPDSESETDGVPLVITGYSEGALTRLTVSGRYDFVIERDGETAGGYRLADFAYPETVDASLVANAVNAATNIMADKYVEDAAVADVEELSKFGIDFMSDDLPRVKAEFELPASDPTPNPTADPTADVKTETAEFIIGAESVGSTYIGVLHGEAVKIYTADTAALKYYETDVFQFVNRSPVPAYDYVARPDLRLTVTRGSDSFEMTVTNPPQTEAVDDDSSNDEDLLAKLNTGELIKPVSAPLDLEKSEKYLYGLFGISAADVFGVGLSTGGITGDPVSLEVTAALAGGQVYTLTLYGTDGSGRHYGVVSSLPDVCYVFDDSDLPWLDMTADNLRRREFLMPYIYTLSEIDLSVGDTALSFAVSGSDEKHEFKVSGRAGDTVAAETLTGEREESFTALYRFIIGLRGEKLYSGDIPEGAVEAAAVTYKYRAGGEDTVKLIDFAGTVYVEVNGEPTYTVKKLYLQRLSQNVKAFIDGGKITENW